MLSNILRKFQSTFHPVVPFNADEDKLLQMDFTLANKDLTADLLNNTDKFSSYIDQRLQKAGARYGIGGYKENRTVYSRSKNFDGEDGEPRRLHLGIDIWAAAGTPVFAPMGGMIHSFAFNDNFGDYGATIILLHQLEGTAFYTLYGHVSLADISVITEGNYISHGQEFAHFGEPKENGNWPPHLHLQVITNLELKKGDYPGVCRLSEREKYLDNCPDPDFIINMMEHAKGA